MIDFTKPVWFYDDRGKDDNVFELEKVLWANEKYALCQVIVREYDESTIDPNQLRPLVPFNFSAWSEGESIEPLLIDLIAYSVCNSEYDSWYATNDMNWWRPFGWDNL